MFTTLQGKAPSDIKGLLRPVIAAILPVNNKRDATASGGLPTFAVYPTWHVPGVGRHSFCLCVKHQVPISELGPWNCEGESAVVAERFKMCRPDFKSLQQLCERNERLRGLVTSEIRLENLGLDDLGK